MYKRETTNTLISLLQTALTFLHGCCRSFCILLCQRSAPAAVRKGAQRGQLSVASHTAGSPLYPASPPGVPRSQDDPAADLSPAEGDEADQGQRGCCCSCCCHQEAGLCSSGPGVSGCQVGEEVCPQLSQAQTQHKTCELTPQDLLTSD